MLLLNFLIDYTRNICTYIHFVTLHLFKYFVNFCSSAPILVDQVSDRGIWCVRELIIGETPSPREINTARSRHGQKSPQRSPVN